MSSDLAHAIVVMSYMSSDVAHAIVMTSYMDMSSDVAHAIVVMSYMDMSSDLAHTFINCGDVIYEYILLLTNFWEYHWSKMITWNPCIFNTRSVDF